MEEKKERSLRLKGSRERGAKVRCGRKATDH